MIRIRFVLLLVLMAMAASCSRSSINERELFANADTITVDLDNIRPISLNAVFDKISFLRLETNKNCMIAVIDDVLFMENSIAVVDKNMSKAVFLFDYNGKFVNRLSYLGNGPREYLNINHVFKVTNSIIAIQDRMKDVVLYFDDKGTFLYQTKGLQYGCDIECIGCNRIAVDVRSVGGINNPKTEDYAFVVSDSLYQKVYAVGTDTYSEKLNYGATKRLFRYNDIVYGIPNFENYVYQFDSEGVCVKYVLDIISDDVSDFRYSTREELKQLEQRYPFFKGHFYEFDNYSCFVIKSASFNAYILYNHQTKDVYLLDSEYANPLITFFWNPYMVDAGNAFVTSSLPATLLSYKEQFYDGVSVEIRKDLDLLYNDMKVDDNPVLFFYHLKDTISE